MNIFQKAKKLVIPSTLHLKNSPIVVMDTFIQKGNEQQFIVFTDQVIRGDSKGVYKDDDEAVTFLDQIQVIRINNLNPFLMKGFNINIPNQSILLNLQRFIQNENRWLNLQNKNRSQFIF
ncbi:unnamed protein product [Paramecium sonneborni]|uniref:Uncharacterized protein n=1 Tax=Paramecium sonneborni TaxID=65129 RepID=A0A8S1NYY1_9CILI|nr:unnamed protein product [Paramecium sonneborni]